MGVASSLIWRRVLVVVACYITYIGAGSVAAAAAAPVSLTMGPRGGFC